MRSGSIDARADLCANHYAEMRLYVEQLGLPEGDCDDLVQQIFVVACRKNAVIPESIPEQRAWLCEIAGPLVRNHKLIERRQSRAREFAPLPVSAEAMAMSPEEITYAREALRVLFEGTTPEEQALVRRYLLEDATLDELAAEIGISRSAVWARVDTLRKDMLAHFAILQSRDQRWT
ncbi:RNA polymerase sigma factor [Polyangium aurulentum]|uniref:RNA polymerase sigma factor n=1 Tax=Polyangium aurulentum TaxID=2567896 RepID=UPI0010ADF0AF|nr:sigma-70 family RNA polymerase sigma factor [Polyangium aurulentum]UQA58104.1 sigma-70 family RNA polymerase sigma factor [Polyangium aurulentum]